uniref:tetratricopeptide repeat-containing sensor histidine kinase n=1 Tax=Gelidibacter sp. TaxID=2018083 RepID=UPI004049CDC2
MSLFFTNSQPKQFVITIMTILLVLINGLTVSSQNNLDSLYNIAVGDLIANKSTSYTIIEAKLLRFKNDSLKMKSLISKAQSKDLPDIESYAHNALGIIYRNISAYDKAIAAHLQAKKLAEEAEDVEQLVISLNMLGVVYRRMDLVKPALDYHKQAIDIAYAVKNPSFELKHSIAVSQNSMGNIYLTLKQYDLALNQFKKSIIIEKESNNRLGLAINHQNIGFVDEAQGRLDEALKNYQKSLEYNNSLDSEVGRAICYNSIGQIYIKQGRYNEAKDIIENGLEKALKIKDQFYISLSYINLGWASSKLNLDKQAEDYLNIALQIGEQYSFKTAIVDANKYLSDLYVKKGDYKTAMTYYVNSIEMDKTVANERNLQYVNDIIIQYENESKNSQIRALANENELVKSKLERNQRIFWYSLAALIVIAVIMISIHRNRQLKHEKQILTLEQDMLRSQMNPHFIFNSLNSIKLYIINNEKENAVYYLNKFSKFIRKILIASTEKEISLEDELDTMQLYMNIENIRFSNEIDFQVNVDKNINTASIKVPSLILQPFLENSLWHGLSSKKEDKKIVLNVSKTSDEFVTISIIDNGIGRNASAKINDNKLLKRKSVGLAITKARLANFSKGFTNTYKIDIEDLYSETNKAIGTKVVVQIPVKSSALKSA